MHSYRAMRKTIVFFIILGTAASAVIADNRELNSPGVSFIPENIPSALWPTFVETKDDAIFKKSTRGTLIRVENDILIVDFGRKGIIEVAPESTDFYQQVSALMLGETTKEFPNFSLQVGNKMMTFGRGDQSGAIRFEDTQHITLYVLLYLDRYDPSIAKDLMNFGSAYDALKVEHPTIEVVLMPDDREFYNFGFTVGYTIPFIATHMRKGYINSLYHKVDDTPGFVAVDTNGRIMGRSETPLEWDNLAEALEELLEEAGIRWSRPPRAAH